MDSREFTARERCPPQKLILTPLLLITVSPYLAHILIAHLRTAYPRRWMVARARGDSSPSLVLPSSIIATDIGTRHGVLIRFVGILGYISLIQRTSRSQLRTSSPQFQEPEPNLGIELAYSLQPVHYSAGRLIARLVWGTAPHRRTARARAVDLGSWRRGSLLVAYAQ